MRAEHRKNSEESYKKTRFGTVNRTGINEVGTRFWTRSIAKIEINSQIQPNVG